MARYDDLNTTAIGYAAVISTIILVVIILLFRAMNYYWVEAAEAKALEGGAHFFSADAMIAEQKARVAAAGKSTVTILVKDDAGESVEKEVERQHIPLEKAREILLKELAESK